MFTDSKHTNTWLIVLAVVLGVVGLIMILAIILITRCLIRNKQKRNAIRHVQPRANPNPSTQRPNSNSQPQLAQANLVGTLSSNRIVQPRFVNSAQPYRSVEYNPQLVQPVVANMNNLPLSEEYLHHNFVNNLEVDHIPEYNHQDKK